MHPADQRFNDNELPSSTETRYGHVIEEVQLIGTLSSQDQTISGLNPFAFLDAAIEESEELRNLFRAVLQ